MQEVKMYLEEYDLLQNRILTKTDRINALEQELSNLKESHKEEIEKLVKEGKVKIVTKAIPLTICDILDGKGEPSVAYEGFDDVKAEVYRDFKQALFDEELEKHKQEQLASLVKQLAEKENAITDLKATIERLKNRSPWVFLWDCLKYKF